MTRGLGLAVALGVASAALGCTGLVERAGVALYYRKAEHPDALTRLDVRYVQDGDPKHRLDVFLPADHGSAGDAPVLVFVHGGGFTYGDRAQSAGGADVYRNIGRFYADRGLVAVVISYRLQPGVDWHAQVADVGAAVRFVRDHAAGWGGDPHAIFLSGHSAGAHLSARYALDPDARRGAAVCGLVLVSGAAYDLADEQTYRLGADPAWFVERFDDGAAAWRARGSVVPLVSPASPPALVLYASGEPEKLRRQSDLLVEAYRAAGAPVRQVVVPGEDHQRIILTLSRDDRTAGPAILEFVEGTACPGAAEGSADGTAAADPGAVTGHAGRGEREPAGRRDRPSPRDRHPAG